MRDPQPRVHFTSVHHPASRLKHHSSHCQQCTSLTGACSSKRDTQQEELPAHANICIATGGLPSQIFRVLMQLVLCLGIQVATWNLSSQCSRPPSLAVNSSTLHRVCATSLLCHTSIYRETSALKHQAQFRSHLWPQEQTRITVIGLALGTQVLGHQDSASGRQACCYPGCRACMTNTWVEM
jgi:hypothetical protein